LAKLPFSNLLLFLFFVVELLERWWTLERWFIKHVYWHDAKLILRL